MIYITSQGDPELVLSKKLIELNTARDCALLQASLWYCIHTILGKGSGPSGHHFMLEKTRILSLKSVGLNFNCFFGCHMHIKSVESSLCMCVYVCSLKRTCTWQVCTCVCHICV